MRLCDLPLDTRAIVQRFDTNNSLSRRITALGLEEGATVTALFRSPFGDPTAYYVNETVIALRKTDCESIHVAEAL